MGSETPTKKGPAKKPTTKKPADHPIYFDMVQAAIIALKDRKGSSRQAIVKYVQSNYNVGEKSDVHVKNCLRKGVQAKVLQQVKGTGASGSFKLTKKVADKPKKEKKPAAKSKAKKAAPTTTAKKPAATKKVKKTPTKKKTPVKKASPAAKSQRLLKR